MRFLILLLLCLLPLEGYSQALWRNFFTTNQNPIVDVAAGSNATVVATTPAVNIRRFTVSSTATGGGQTNITVVKPDDGSVVISTNISGGVSTYGVGLSAILTNQAYGTNIIGAVPESTHSTNSDNAINATNLYNANLPIPTNSPAAGKVVTATSASSSEWATASGGVTVPNEMIAKYATLFGMSNFWESANGQVFKDNFSGAAIIPNIVALTASGGGGTLNAGPSASSRYGYYRIHCYPTNTASIGGLRTAASSTTGIRTKFAIDTSLIVSGYEGTDIRIGAAISTTLNPTDAITWAANTNWSPNWIAICTSNSTSTTWTSSVPVTLSSTIRLSILATEAKAIFYTNAIYATEITDNIPIAETTTRYPVVALRVMSNTSSGSSDAQFTYLDWLWFLYD